MTLATNLVSSASFRCEMFFKIALGTMLFCCWVKICWQNTLLKHQTVRSNHQGVQSVLKNFTNFARKNLCWSLFLINPEGLQFYSKVIQHRCFPVKFAIFLKTPKFLKLQQHNLFISYWMDLVLPSTPIIHVINLLLNNVTCIAIFFRALLLYWIYWQHCQRKEAGSMHQSHASASTNLRDPKAYI